MLNTRWTDVWHRSWSIKFVFCSDLYFFIQSGESTLKLSSCHLGKSPYLKFVTHCGPWRVVSWTNWRLNKLSTAFIIRRKSMSSVCREPLSSSCQLAAIRLHKESRVWSIILNNFLIERRISSFSIVFSRSRSITEVIKVWSDSNSFFSWSNTIQKSWWFTTLGLLFQLRKVLSCVIGSRS